MEYATRIGDNSDEAHVNYQCPCGCTAGLMYSRESGSQHVGQCCCGRLLWLGADGQAVVTSHFEAGVGYDLDISSVTLPWGETTTALLAVPARTPSAQLDSEHFETHEHPHSEHSHHDDDAGGADGSRSATAVRDVVCGMMVDPASAAGSSVYRSQTYYFCSLGCKRQFDADPTRFVKSRGLLARILGRS